MITSAADERIREVNTTDDELIVSFVDGRTLSVPLVWYPRLFHASPEQRTDWQLIGDGDGVHWPQIDEDLSAAGLLRGSRALAYENVPKPKRSDAQESGVTVKRPVHVTPREEGWAVVREGYEDKPSSVHRTQKEAEQRGREKARKDATFFFLHDRQGNIREQSTYLHEISPKNAMNVLWKAAERTQEASDDVGIPGKEEEIVVPVSEEEIVVSRVDVAGEEVHGRVHLEEKDEDEKIVRRRP